MAKGSKGGGVVMSFPAGKQPEWHGKIIRSTNTGEPKACAFNVLLILEHDPELAGIFSLDEFGNRITLGRAPPWRGGTREEFTEIDGLELAAWLEDPARYGMARVSDELVLKCVEATARRSKRHSVREYLEALTWDGTPRVRRLFVDLFGADATDYNLGAAECFMVGAVSRILWCDPTQPTKGSKVDFMPVLEGMQGAGKTTAVLELFSANWYAEATESPAHKDFYQTLRGRWGLEIGEMDSFTKADVAKVKQAITVRFDVYRPSYGRTARSFRRECVFVGTTNKDDYLRDDTGARRFLPVKVGTVRIPDLVGQRDQLWAEAVAMFRAGFKWWVLPPDAKREQDARFSEDVWTERIETWLAGKAPPSHYEGFGAEDRGKGGEVNECSAADLLGYALRLATDRHDRSSQTRVGSIMTRLGWGNYRPAKRGTRVRCYFRPYNNGDDPAGGSG
jgi:predicted P-loop ATPase